MCRILSVATLVVLFGTQATAAVLYQQPPSASGGVYLSSWWDPDGSNYDEYVWDKFTLGSSANVDVIEWRGAYNPVFGSGGPVVDFTVAVYGSIPGGSQPDFSQPALVEYEVGGNAGESYAGVFGGLAMYDYRFALPSPFPAQAGVPYWVEIEAWQGGFPDWNVAAGTGGDNYHFRCQHLTLADGVPTGCWFTAPSGDAAFTLLSTPTGVEALPAPVELALRGALPNPSNGDRLSVGFSLPTSAPAELALFDVLGRRIALREVGALGAGTHVVDLVGPVPFAPGVYFARLSQGARTEMVKVVVAR